MIKQIGTKIYYCTLSGNVIKIIGDMQGYVKETVFEKDYEIYRELKERDKDSIGLLTFEYGEYGELSENSTGVKVDLETKELIFTYDELPIPPQEPTLDEIVQEQGNKISILSEKVDAQHVENTRVEEYQNRQDGEILDSLLASTELFEMVLGMVSPSSYNTKNNDNGGSSMIEVYATLIIKDKKTLEDVPMVIREQVRQRLIELGIPGYETK